MLSPPPLQGEVPKAEGVPLAHVYLAVTAEGPPQSLRDSSPCKGERVYVRVCCD